MSPDTHGNVSGNSSTVPRGHMLNVDAKVYKPFARQTCDILYWRSTTGPRAAIKWKEIRYYLKHYRGENQINKKLFQDARMNSYFAIYFRRAITNYSQIECVWHGSKMVHRAWINCAIFCNQIKSDIHKLDWWKKLSYWFTSNLIPDSNYGRYNLCEPC